MMRTMTIKTDRDSSTRMRSNFDKTRTVLSSLINYTRAHNGMYPSAATWETAIQVHADLLPEGNSTRRLAFNEKLAGKIQEKAPGNAIVLYETETASRNAHGDPAHDKLLSTNKSGDKAIIAYNNGNFAAPF